MREIRNGALSGMTSPIRHVMQHVHEAIINIAPERKDAFLRALQDFILEYLDTDEFDCCVKVRRRHIFLTRKVVEVFWAASLAYFRIYREGVALAGGRELAHVELNLRTNPRLRPAMDLLAWAMRSSLCRTEENWPLHLPHPVVNPPHASDEHVASELALSATAWALQHELMHVRLWHLTGSSIPAEREADNAATDWILAAVDDEEHMAFVKRSLGIVIALVVLVGRGVHGGSYGGRSHPYSYHRLLSALDRHITDPNHQAWSFAVVALKLHMDNPWYVIGNNHGARWPRVTALKRRLNNVARQVRVPAGPFDTFRDCAVAYIRAFSWARWRVFLVKWLTLLLAAIAVGGIVAFALWKLIHW